MPSPFPGMDPYLETPELWPDVHHAVIGHTTRSRRRELPLSHAVRARKARSSQDDLPIEHAHATRGKQICVWFTRQRPVKKAP